jgi:cytochrome c oxidase accessory protein FixG
MSEKTCHQTQPRLLSPWRRRCQWAATLLLLLTPWIQLSGNSLFRIDIPELTIYFFGQTLRIEELYLVLLFSLAMTLGFLLVTMLLGRVWCGWFCPQTTLTDLAEWFAARLGLQGKKGQNEKRLGKRLALHAFYLVLAFLVSSNLLWYFIKPLDFFAGLAALELHYASWICLLTVAAVIYLDLALIRRLMCSEFCPYGRFQTVLADKSTLALHLPPAELRRCIKCNSCVRACPMQIDIRDGYQVECINCGRCLDACRQIMSKRNQPGLISYTFGTEGKGVRTTLNPRTILLGMVTLTLVAILFFAAHQRPEASLKIAVSHMASSRALKDGNRATFFNAWINNRSDIAATYDIKARQAETVTALTLKGRTSQLKMQAGENLRVDFVLVTAVPKPRLDVEFILLDQNGKEMAISQAYIEE